jgi:hypothetical protein
MPCLARNPSFYAEEEEEGVWYKVHQPSDEQETEDDFSRQKDVEHFAIRNDQWIEDFLQTEAAIDASRVILDLHEGWDDGAGVGYAFETWRRATNFVKAQAILARDWPGVRFSPPRINPADNGTIDVYWQLSDRRLLINIPAAAEAKATFYGETRTGETIGGKVDLKESSPQFMIWLKQTR